jgi:phosphatidate phosphatase APP1
VQLDAVAYVGATAFKALLAHATTLGYVAECLSSGIELGLVSDLDLTVIPDHKKDYPEVDPYPGVGALYKVLEFRREGKPGDIFYVTARTPERVAQLPAWMAEHGVPAGHFETGTSGMPWIAEKEKVKDITAVMQARKDQKFVLFGDTSQRDPEVYRQIMTAFPGRVTAALVHEVTENVPASRVEGMHLYAHYPEAAAILCGLGVIDEVEANSVMDAARQEGMALSQSEAQALSSKHGCPPKP